MIIDILVTLLWLLFTISIVMAVRCHRATRRLKATKSVRQRKRRITSTFAEVGYDVQGADEPLKQFYQ